MIDPDLAAFVGARRVVAVRRQKPSWQIADAHDAPRRRNPVHVHVHRGEEDAHLLPVAGRRRVGGGSARDEYAAVRRRQHAVVVRRRGAVWIAEEEGEKGAEREKRNGKNPRDSGARDEREGQRAANERQAGGIQTQPLTLLTVAPQDVFHPVFQLQLAFLEVGFFDLLGFGEVMLGDRKSTRLNSSHEWISYAVFCLKKK